MPERSHAIFLSYASQDAESAQKICEALRAAGIQVWFDQSELRSGDVWDRQIRERIQDCRLFLPIISAHTEARAEGYFRREWKLAVDRTHEMSERLAFIVPVVVDRTSDATADVPDAFRSVQWTHLPAGETPPEFVTRIQQLLAGKGGFSPTAARAAAAASGKSSLLKPAWVALAVALAAVGAYTIVEGPRIASPAGLAPAAQSEKSIAVLPFVDMSEKHDEEYFADGMSEEILDLLARIPQLTVIGRTSSFQFKGRNEDLRAIGNKLGAAYVVEGSVRKSGSRIRVTSQLVDTRSGAHLWSDSYDRDFGDTLTLQDQIAASIARTLQLAVTAAEPASRGLSRSMDAYTLYLRGRLAFDRGDVAAFTEAQQDFEQALALDPSFARAADGVLISYLNKVYAGVVSSKVGWPRVQQLAARLLQLDPHSAFAHSALAWFHYSYDYDWAACNREIDTVLAAHTHDSTALVYAGYVAGAIGRNEDGTGLIHEALVFDPLNPDAYQALGGILGYQGDYAGAERAYRKSLEISPLFAGSHLYIGAGRLFRGRPQEALPEIEAEPSGVGRDALLAATYFALGRKRDSDASLARLLETPAEGKAFWIAVAYALRNENDLAFEWLEKAYESRDLGLSMGRTDYFAPLHGDPRWKPFLHRMNIPE